MKDGGEPRAEIERWSRILTAPKPAFNTFVISTRNALGDADGIRVFVAEALTLPHERQSTPSISALPSA